MTQTVVDPQQAGVRVRPVAARRIIQHGTGRTAGAKLGLPLPEPNAHAPELLHVLGTWRTDEPPSERASAEGVLYLWSSSDPTRLTAVAHNRALTKGLLEALTGILKPGQALVAVASYFRFRREVEHPGEPLPGGPLEDMLPHVLWVVAPGNVWKVRQPHQTAYVPRSYYTDPLVLVTEYTPPHTSLSYTFIGQEDVMTRMTGSASVTA